MGVMMWLLVAGAILVALALCEPILYPHARADYHRRRAAALAAAKSE